MEHQEFGFRPIAFIREMQNRRLRREEIIEQLIKVLPKFKLPDQFYRWPEPVLQNPMKLDRKLFIQLAKKGDPSLESIQ